MGVGSITLWTRGVCWWFSVQGYLRHEVKGRSGHLTCLVKRMAIRFQQGPQREHLHMPNQTALWQRGMRHTLVETPMEHQCRKTLDPKKSNL